MEDLGKLVNIVLIVLAVWLVLGVVLVWIVETCREGEHTPGSGGRHVKMGGEEEDKSGVREVPKKNRTDGAP